MSEIVEKFKYLCKKAEYFQQLNDDVNFLFDEIKKISKKNIIDLQSIYRDEEKIKKIRYEVANLLLNEEFSRENFENLKKEINQQYSTNILQSWKDFSILYIFFFNPIKETVNQYLKEIGDYLIQASGIQLKLKTTNFDGAQNFGEVGCWLALYNPKYKSQREGIQYFINFYDNNTTYGTYRHDNKQDIKRQKYDIENLDNNIIQSIVDDIKAQANVILEDIAEGEENMPNDNKRTQPLNQILYGPPGTGKTYNTINKALEIIFTKEIKEEEFKYKIIENEKIKEVKNTYSKIISINDDKEKRKHLKGLFDYFTEKQIVFTTFHQSYGYEEFVEGIKPCGLDGDCDKNDPLQDIRYVVKDGIFKSLSKKAKEKTYTIDNKVELKTNTKVWKISLGGSGSEHKVKKDCFDNDLVRIGWESVYQIGDAEFDKLGSKDKNTLENFFNEMEEGDFVISLGSQKEADGIGIIEGDYERDDYLHYPHKRKVRWLSKNKSINIFELNGSKNLVQQTVYELKRLNSASILELLDLNSTISEDNSNKNYVLIIDEINRGNISKIFGELITLIEDSKRIGADEEIRVKLPYSGDEFGVPKNLYIIGTMNTADRSIALMDTALRRRFHFEEMMPNPELLEKIKIKNSDQKEIEIDLGAMLQRINERITYLYDRDHQIGHAYFMGVDSLEKLDDVFRNKIIPLLQEYFYDDWEKIQIVLGDHFDQINGNKNSSGKDESDFDSELNKVRFIQSIIAKESDVLGFNHDDIEDEKKKYRVNPAKQFPMQAYAGIIKPNDKKPKNEKQTEGAENANPTPKS